MMRHKKEKHSVDRRELLALGAAGVGALAVNGSPLSVASAFAATASARPNFYPAPVAPADIAGDANGLEPAYINFPKKQVKLVNETPGKGGDVTAMSLWIWAIPTPVEKNPGWQQLQKGINANIRMNYVPQADYAAKWGTVTAGGDLPDLLYMSLVPVLPNVAAFVNSACADLSGYLGGDAVKAYPGLANIPSACWSQAIIDGKLWGVPISRERTGWPMYYQLSLLEKMGIAGKLPASADDFKAFCKAVNNPAAGQWAMGVTNDATSGPYSMNWFQGMFGAPNKWRLNANGSLLRDIETEEYKAALAYNRELTELGYVSPDVKSNADLTNDLLAGKIVMRSNPWAGYKSAYVERAKAVGKTFRTLPPFGAKGGPGTALLGPGNFGWVAMKKSSPDRVAELLRIMNYLASPIGSEEFLVTKFGAEGVDWTYDERGAPKYTQAGLVNMPAGPNVGPWGFVSTPAPYLFSSEVPEFAQFASAEEKKVLAVGVSDPTLGYYSATDARSGAQLERLIFDVVSGIAAGRKPMSDLDALVKDWKAQGGDRIREEYQKAIAA